MGYYDRDYSSRGNYGNRYRYKNNSQLGSAQKQRTASLTQNKSQSTVINTQTKQSQAKSANISIFTRNQEAEKNSRAQFMNTSSTSTNPFNIKAPEQTPTQMQAPAEKQSPTQTQAPTETQAPAQIQATAQTPETSSEQEVIDNRPASEIYSDSKNPYATIIRSQTGTNKNIKDNAQAQGREMGRKVAQDITKAAAEPDEPSATSLSLAGAAGATRGAREGMAAGESIAEAMDKLDNATDENVQEALNNFKQTLEALDQQSIENLNKEYAKRNLAPPEVTEPSELAKQAQQIGELSKIPLPVAKELANLTPSEIGSTLDALKEAGDSKVKQATALAEHCPAALSSIVDDMTKGGKAGADSSNGYDFAKDMEENGAALMSAISNMPDKERGDIKDSIVEAVKQQKANGDNSKLALDKVLTPENLDLANKVIEQDKAALSGLMEDTVDVLKEIAPENNTEKASGFIDKFNQGALALAKAIKYTQTMGNLINSGILDTLQSANPEAYAEIRRMIPKLR